MKQTNSSSGKDPKDMRIFFEKQQPEEWVGNINKERLEDCFSRLVSIDSESFHEKEMAAAITDALKKLDVTAVMDESAAQTGSNAGNLFAFVPGRGEYKKDEEPLLFMAHMDTVAPGRGKRAIVHKDGTITSDGSTVLGADDLTAVSSILEALTSIQENRLPHRPLELLFTTAEEAYTKGASAFDFSKSHAREAFAFDCSDKMGSYSQTEPTLLSFTIEVHGRAAHAGFEPEKGINALLVALRAAAQLPLGRADTHTTLNIGRVEAGTATNIVPDLAVLSGEIRSLVHEDALALYQRVVDIFKKEAVQLGASVGEKKMVHLTAYRIDDDDPALVRYQKVLAQLGVSKSSRINFGGSDINVVRRLGKDGICIANPMYGAHTTHETTNMKELVLLAEIIQRLMLS